MSTALSPAPPVFERVLGQSRAVGLLAGSLEAPLHAYLFLGPPGSGKRRASTAFAAALLCPNGGCGDCPSCRDVLNGRHPDVNVVERQGASILVGAARTVAQLAQRAPSVGRFQIVVLVDFHLVDEAAPALLKTIEEPPPTTIFIILADALPRQLVTIASRCVPVHFAALDDASVAAQLVEEGVDPGVASAAAAAAHGRIDRASLLAADPQFAARQERWREVPERLDGTGATVATVAAALVAGAEQIASVLQERQEAELAELAEQATRRGDRSIPGRQEIEARHKRELRRVRTDELRAGLATLAAAYRGRLDTPNLPARREVGLLRCCDQIDEFAKWIERNPNELLQLQSLLIDLDAG